MSVQILFRNVPDSAFNNTPANLIVGNHDNSELPRLLLELYYGGTLHQLATVSFRYNPSLSLPLLSDPFKPLVTSLKPLTDKKATLVVDIYEPPPLQYGKIVLKAVGHMSRQKQFKGKSVDENGIRPPLNTFLSQVKYLQEVKEEFVISVVNNVKITTKDFQRYANGQELNDTIIDFHNQLICERAEMNPETMPSVYAFSALFWTNISNHTFDKYIARWTKNVTLANYDILLFPVNRNKYWSLVVVHQRLHLIEYFDPLKFEDDGVTDVIRRYLISEHCHSTGGNHAYSHWQVSVFDKFHRQNNAIDCGVYICAFAKYRTNGFTLRPMDISDFRTKMTYELLHAEMTVD